MINRCKQNPCCGDQTYCTQLGQYSEPGAPTTNPETSSALLKRLRAGEAVTPGHEVVWVQNMRAFLDTEMFRTFPEWRDVFKREFEALLTASSEAATTIERLTAAPPDDADEMLKISALIARLQSTFDQFGDTCVYIRRGGLSWGAVALNRRSDDQKNGVFDLQATHDREMEERLGQVSRLIEDRNEWRDKALAAEERLGRYEAALKEAREQIAEMVEAWDGPSRPGLWRSNSLGVLDRIDAALHSSEKANG